MTQVISDRRDIEFVIHEQLEAENLSQLHENFAAFNKKTINLVISEAKNFAVKELLPSNKEGDEQGCTLENGKVTTPDSFKRLYKIFNEGEWLAVCDDPKYGGQGMPKILATASGGDQNITDGTVPFITVWAESKQMKCTFP